MQDGNMHMVCKEEIFFNCRIEVQEKNYIHSMGSQVSWLKVESVGDLETSQGSISISSLDSGYHPRGNLKQKERRKVPRTQHLRHS